MADEKSPPDSELTPEQESMVRRLLADARHDEGIPDNVADRLDRVLAQLHDEHTSTDSPVVELAARRRRRNAARLLMAAAAIVLGGVTVGQFFGTPNSSGDDAGTSTAADGGSERSESREDDGGDNLFEAPGAAAPETALESAPAYGDSAAAEPQDDQNQWGPVLDRELPLKLSADSFEQDMLSLNEDRNQSLAKLAAAAEKSRNLIRRAPAFDCPPAAYGQGTLVPAYYDDEPVVLAFRPPLGSNQVAELLRCGTAEKLRSVDLDTPAND